jgi:hypothetical protein
MAQAGPALFRLPLCNCGYWLLACTNALPRGRSAERVLLRTVRCLQGSIDTTNRMRTP